MLNASSEARAAPQGAKANGGAKDPRHVVSDIEKAVGKAKTELRDMAREAGHRSRAIIDEAGEEISGAKKSVATFIRKKPLAAGGIAVGIGVLLGMFLRRR
ncbi:MAG TPA: hypothetical protein VMV79_08650 [Alphaproteobacteria bacterium]|nr:hypothetical protein [Alphaproteobacteria bacterium]